MDRDDPIVLVAVARPSADNESATCMRALLARKPPINDLHVIYQVVSRKAGFPTTSQINELGR